MAHGITCSSCGKTYPFKAELAGRKVKCKCGHVIAVPSVPVEKHQEPDSLYDLAPDPTAASARPAQQTVMARTADDSVRCPSCESPLEAGSVICVACGFNLKTGEKMKGLGGGGGGSPVGAAAAKGNQRPGHRLAVPPGLSAKKMANEPKSGVLVKGGLVLVAMLLVVGAIFAMRYVGRDPNADKPPADPDDATVADAKANFTEYEARAFLKTDETWLMGGWNRRQAEAKIDEWYQMGAKKVSCFGPRMAIWVAIELPDEPEKRAKLFEWQKKWNEEMYERVRTDKGQKYLAIKLPL